MCVKRKKVAMLMRSQWKDKLVLSFFNYIYLLYKNTTKACVNKATKMR